MNKLDTIHTNLDRLANGFKEMKGCLKELRLSPPLSSSTKKVMKKKVIEVQLPLSLFGGVTKREITDEEDGVIKTGFGVLNTFSLVDDVKSSKKKVVMLRFETYGTMIKMNDAIVVFCQ